MPSKGLMVCLWSCSPFSSASICICTRSVVPGSFDPAVEHELHSSSLLWPLSLSTDRDWRLTTITIGMSSTTKSNSVVPLEMEQLSFTRNDGFEQDVSSTQSPQQQFFHPCQALLYWFQNLGALIAAYASYYSHITIPVVAVCVIVAVILGLDFIVSASTHKKHVAMVKHDYTDSHSVYELKMQLVDHWCLSVSVIVCCV